MSIVALAGCAKTETPPANEPPVVPPLLGGDRDAHGCIPSAGYQWCEAKQKCLRTWEEPCEMTGSGAVDTSSWMPYQNDMAGFSLKFPSLWEGFNVTQGSFTGATSVSFSFGAPHQPFEIFKILKFDAAQWEEQEVKEAFTALSVSANAVLVCDGCCKEGGDVLGGGQFDIFQQERCAEVPKILKTFERVE